MMKQIETLTEQQTPSPHPRFWPFYLQTRSTPACYQDWSTPVKQWTSYEV